MYNASVLSGRVAEEDGLKRVGRFVDVGGLVLMVAEISGWMSIKRSTAGVLKRLGLGHSKVIEYKAPDNTTIGSQVS